jgi:Fe2+ or Zn2+ uptake regulation protein
VETVVRDLTEERYRITASRRSLLRRIAAYTRPFTAEQLYADIRAGGEPGGRATVYRTLDLLLAHHWLLRVHGEEGDHAYVVTDGGHQHPLVCSSCGLVIAFEGCDLNALLGGLADRLGFKVEGHWLEAFGKCRACQRTSAGPPLGSVQEAPPTAPPGGSPLAPGGEPRP